MNAEKGITRPVKSDLVPPAGERQVMKVFLVSYVPRTLENGSVNIAVVMVGNGSADVRFARDWKRVLAVDPEADTDLLTELTREIRDKMRVPDEGEEMLLRMEDSWSNTVQVSIGRGCLTEDPATEIEALASQYL
jgi:hypothetical protein